VEGGPHWENDVGPGEKGENVQWEKKSRHGGVRKGKKKKKDWGVPDLGAGEGGMKSNRLFVLKRKQKNIQKRTEKRHAFRKRRKNLRHLGQGHKKKGRDITWRGRRVGSPSI